MPNKDLVLEFTSFHEVLESYARRLSEEGIFLETSESLDVGSEVDFHVRIRDGFSVLRGQGEVVQSTDEGCFVRLIDLDRPSLKLLPKLLEHYRRKGVPLMELPQVVAAEVEVEEQESREMLEVDLAADPEIDAVPRQDSSVDDLFESEETAVESSDKVGLTLDDLEAEFRAETADPDPVGEVDVDFDVDLESENPQADPGSVLIEAEELAVSSDGGALLVAEKVEPEIEVLSPEKDLEVDAGLPWLPEEPEKAGKKDIWVILLLVLLGAALGAAFYVFVIRPNAQQGWKSMPTETLQAQAGRAVESGEEMRPASYQTTSVGPQEEPQPVAKRAAAEVDSEEPPADTEAPLTGVDRITWGDEAGETVVTLWADGSFLAEQVDDFRVNGEQPREVVRIRGVQRPFAQHRIELGTDHVRQIRTGFHEEDGVNSLHFVADLVDFDVELLRTEAAGEQLRVYFSKTG